MQTYSSHAPAYTSPGDLLSTNIDAFRTAVLPRVDKLSSGQYLDLDLRASRLIDSVGLNALVTVIKRAKAQNAQVRIRTGHASVRRILTFTRIDSHAIVLDPGAP